MSCTNRHTWVLAEISFLGIGFVCNADMIQSYTIEHQPLEESFGMSLHRFAGCKLTLLG